MKNMSRKNILGLILAGVFVVTAGVFGFYMWDFAGSLQSTAVEKPVLVSEQIAPSSKNKETISSNEMVVGINWEGLKKKIDEAYPDAEHIEKGQIQWHDPVDLGDLGWTDKVLYSAFPGVKKMKNASTGVSEDFISGGIKYVEAGTITQGRDKDSKIVILYTNAGLAEPRTPQMYYSIVNQSEKRILLSGVETDSREYVKADLSAYVKNPNFDEKTVIDELIVYPRELRGRTDREIFQKKDYPQEFFLTTERLTRIFSDPIFGQVWMGEKEEKYSKTAQDDLLGKFNTFTYFDANKKATPFLSSDISEGGFYLRRPDGTAVAYRQKFDIFDTFDRVGVLQATWNDGTVNADQYEEYPSGCGMTAYVYDVTDTVNLDTDAVAVGKTKQGDVLYGFKDTTHPEFQKLYKDIYWVEDGKKKVSPEMFLKEYPEVFWKNSFGRTLAFYNTKFISPAECGKPVIYLYPKKTTDVSVKVFPSGFTKTDPEYGDGWNVSAEPNGTLTNKMDGKVYPYLFWEGYSDTILQKSERGFVVARENLKSFLDEKLAEQGLIQKEIADFEDFWLPKMQAENRPYYFVTFLPKSQIDALAPLRIDPKPDTVIRVMMDYRGLDALESVTPQTFVTPKRTGFVAVEWGGMLRK